VTTGGIGVHGEGVSNGVGILARNTTGWYAIAIVAVTTNPVTAPIHVEPQSAQPTGPHVIGDMHVTAAGVLKICTAAGTPGTWTSVGAQT
jgi:hypothetical protein